MIGFNSSSLVFLDGKYISFNNFISIILSEAKKSNTYSIIECFPLESEENSIEYKLQLIPKDEKRLNQLLSQMNRRVNNGCGHCVYYIGICDNGEIKGISKYKMTQSIKNIIYMIHKQKYSMSNIQMYYFNNKVDKTLYWCVINITDQQYDNDQIEMYNLFDIKTD